MLDRRIFVGQFRHKMEAFVDISLPIFGIMLAGWFAGRSGLLGQDSTAALNGFVFFVSLPALLFVSSARAPVNAILDVGLISVVVGGYVLTGIIAGVIARIFFSKKIGEVALNTGCSVFANTGYMGIPLMLTAFGPIATNAAVGTVLANILLVLGIATALLEIEKSDARGLSAIQQALLGLVRSPLVVACVAGMGVSAIGIEMPSAAYRFLDLLGAAAGPCALFAMGLFLVGQSVRNDMAEVGWITFLKLIIHPLSTWLIAAFLLPLDPLEEAVAVVMACLPTGGLMFVLSQRYGVYVQRSTAVILVSTVLSVITVSVILQYYLSLLS